MLEVSYGVADKEIFTTVFEKPDQRVVRERDFRFADLGHKRLIKLEDGLGRFFLKPE